jgi:hypothetical protein
LSAVAVDSPVRKDRMRMNATGTAASHTILLRFMNLPLSTRIRTHTAYNIGANE